MFNNEKIFSFKQFFNPLTTRKVIFIIAVLGFIVFGNALFNNFVEDDLPYIINYPLVHQLNIPFSFGENLFNEKGQYRPISATYFSLLYTLFGSSPFFYHFCQLSLHIINAIFLYLLLNILFATINAEMKEIDEKKWNSLS